MNKKKRFTVRIILKSGYVIKFRARSINIDKDNQGGLMKFQYDGVPVRTWYFRHTRPVYVRLDEVASVLTTGV